MKKSYKRILLVGSLPFLLLSCGTPETENSGGNSGNEEKPITPVDKSEYPYIKSLDSTKKEGIKANWIWLDRATSNSYVAFRKKFTLTEEPKNSRATIACEGKYYLWLNEKLAIYDGGVKGGSTFYDSYYQDIDLTKYLKKGENTLVILAHYVGRSGNSSVDKGKAGLLFELHSGKDEVISDTSFKVMRLKEYRNRGLLGGDYPEYPQSSMLAEWNLYYDANYATEGYQNNNFDDSSWSNASVIARNGEAPFNDLYNAMIPPFAFDENYTFLSSEYLNKPLKEDTTFTVKLPENLQFSPYFELTSKNQGARFTYYTNTYTSQGINSFKDDYVAKAGAQTFESYPWRSGDELIIEAQKGITFTKIGFRESKYASSVTGEFKSDNERLNSLWDKCVNTLLICMRDSYMDCPERERSPYIGDSANQISETFYALDKNANELTKKTILSTLGWTSKNNEIPLRSPSVVLNECPAQTLNFLVSTYEYLMYTGDVETMKLFYPLALNYLKLWSLNADGSLITRSGSFPWTDWGEGSDDEVIQYEFYYYALTKVKEIGEIIGESKDKSFFEDRLIKLKNAFGKYKKADGFKSKEALDDRANAMAVVSGLASKEDYPVVLNVLKTVKLASPYMEKFVLEALCQMGNYEDVVERMLDRYGPMIDDPCSTLWELWKKDEGTQNHGWTGGPLVALSKYFGGVTPRKAGFEEYEIKFNNYFNTMKTKVDTPHGFIELDSKIEDEIRKIEIKTIKKDGTLLISSSLGSEVTITGGEFQKLEKIDGYHAFRLKGEKYNIEIK